MTLKLDSKKTLAGVVGVAVAAMMILGGALSANADSSEPTVAELQAQIQQLMEILHNLQGGESTTTPSVSYTFTRDLSSGSTGMDVMKLQEVLNQNADTRVAAVGAGSPGNETQYYGPATANAVSRYQELHASSILYPVGLTSGTGYFGPSTRAAMNAELAASNNGGENEGNGNEGENNNNNGNDLEGSEASFSDFKVRNGRDSGVSEGNTGDVAEVSYDVSNGDVALNRLDVTFTPNNSARPYRVLRSVSVYADGDKIGEVDADRRGDWSQDGNSYTIRISGLDYVVRDGDSGELSIHVKVRDNAKNSGVNNMDVTIERAGARFSNAVGFIQYHDASGSANFSIDKASQGDSLELKSGDNTPADGQTWQVDENSTTKIDPAMTFRLKTGDNDVLLYQVPVQVEVTSDGALLTKSDVDGLIRRAELTLDGRSYRDYQTDNLATSTSGATTTTVDLLFNTDGDRIGGDRTVNGSVALTLDNTKSNGSYAWGTTTSLSVYVHRADFDAVGDQSGDSISVSGSQRSSLNHTLSTEDIRVDNVSAEHHYDSDSDERSFTFTFDVDGDIELSTSTLMKNTKIYGTSGLQDDVLAEKTSGSAIESVTIRSNNSNPTDLDASGGTHYTYKVVFDSTKTGVTSGMYLHLKDVAGNAVNVNAG